MEYQDHVGLWSKELKDWVPDEIFDAHVHIGLEEFVGEISSERAQVALTTYKELKWEDISEFYKKLYSGKKVTGLFAFGFPLREVNKEKANEYIANIMKNDNRVKGLLLSHPKDAKVTISQYEEFLKNGIRFYGAKPYFDFLGKSNYESTMPEFIPDDLLKFLNSESMVLMLHTSGIGMSDIDNQNYVKTISGKYPKVKIILAHMGRYVDPRQFLEFMKSDVLDCPNVYLDMSFVANNDVYKATLSKKAYWKKLIFASDAPFGLMTGMEFPSEGPDPGTIIITRDEYVWSDKELLKRFNDLRNTLTYSTYHTIKAFKDVVDSLNLPNDELELLKNDVFKDNAARLLNL